MKTHYLFSKPLLASILILLLCVTSCGDDEGTIIEVTLTGNSATFALSSKSDPGISGSAVFAETSDGTTQITVNLIGTDSGGDHPAHIHADNAATGGAILIDLTNIEGGTGTSLTTVTAQNDGSAISYQELLLLDGYINVHLSSSELGTLIAQGDVGQNALTGETEDYDLFSVTDPSINGEIQIAARQNGEALATITLEGTSSGESHPAHIHANTAAEGGGILLSFNDIDGETGTSTTNISALDDGTAVTYEELKEIDGYVNVHLSATNLGTLIGQGDIGQNKLTGDEEEYILGSVSDPLISGTATFAERRNGETLIMIDLSGTSSGGDHPSHIHSNTATEGGGIAISLTNVNGETGISKTSVAALDNGTAIAYAELIEFDGYINVHLSSDNLGTFVGQGDIGDNALTGESVEYELGPISDPGISGTVTFSQRNSGFTLISIQLAGTSASGDHPTHIHENSAAEGGAIALDLTNVDGGSGASKTHVEMLNDGTNITYEELIDFDGYVNVHLSASELGILVGQGNIGQNAN